MIPTWVPWSGSHTQWAPPAFIRSRSQLIGCSGKMMCSLVTAKSWTRETKGASNHSSRTSLPVLSATQKAMSRLARPPAS